MQQLHQKYLIFPLILTLAFSTISCSESRSTQCQKVKDIVNREVERSEDVDSEAEAGEEVLQSANLIEERANEIEVLEVQDQTLQDLKLRLATNLRELSHTTQELAKIPTEDGINVFANLEIIEEIAVRQEKAANQLESTIKELDSYCATGELPAAKIPSAAATTSPEAAPVPTPTETPVAKLEPDSFSLGLDKAMSAAVIAQSAIAKDDWDLVANQWQIAIELMKTVPGSNPNYAKSQQKITEYQRNLAIAKQQSQSALNQSNSTQEQTSFKRTSIAPQSNPENSSTASNLVPIHP